MELELERTTKFWNNYENPTPKPIPARNHNMTSWRRRRQRQRQHCSITNPHRRRNTVDTICYLGWVMSPTLYIPNTFDKLCSQNLACKDFEIGLTWAGRGHRPCKISFKPLNLRQIILPKHSCGLKVVKNASATEFLRCSNGSARSRALKKRQAGPENSHKASSCVGAAFSIGWH